MRRTKASEEGSDDYLKCFEKERTALALRGRCSSHGGSFPLSSNYFAAVETKVFDGPHLNGVLAMLTGCPQS